MCIFKSQSNNNKNIIQQAQKVIGGIVCGMGYSALGLKPTTDGWLDLCLYCVTHDVYAICEGHAVHHVTYTQRC